MAISKIALLYGDERVLVEYIEVSRTMRLANGTSTAATQVRIAMGKPN